MDETGTSTVLSEAASALQNLPIAYLLNACLLLMQTPFNILYDYRE